MKPPPRMTKGRFYLVADISADAALQSIILPHEFLGKDAEGKMYFLHPVLGEVTSWKYAYPAKPETIEKPAKKYAIDMPYEYLWARDYIEASLEFSRLIKLSPEKWVVGVDNG